METSTLILPTQSSISQMYSEFGTSEEKMDLDVKILKEWMLKQPHLPNPDDEEKIIDDKRIKMILIMCKNSLEKTKVTLDQHYTIKFLLPEYFSKWDPTSPEIIQAIKVASCVPLPNPTQEGHRVTINYIRNEDAEKFVYNDQAKLYLMSMDLRLAKLDSFNKIITIVDTKNFSMSHVTTMLPYLKNFIESLRAAYPSRIHAIHFVNMKSFVQPLINIALNIINKKIAAKVFTHKSIEELKNYIDPSILPLNYGGTYPKTSEEITDDWHGELMKHREWLVTQSSIIGDNSKRPTNSKSSLDNFENAIDGSFRKLQVD